MSIKAPKNVNYAATVVTLNEFKTLENSDKIKHAIIFGSSVIVSKDTAEGTKGLYFPVECQIAGEFLSNNNLFRNKQLNVDQTKTGFFDENRRVRCVKMRGNASEGFFIPISSLNYIDTKHQQLPNNTTFDQLDGHEICNKYIVRRKGKPGIECTKKGKGAKAKKQSKLIDGQFQFHTDTSQLARNIWLLKPDTPIHISTKIHGSSFIVANVLCKKPLTFLDKCKKFFRLPVTDTEYGILYSSRRVIKNQYIKPMDSPDKGFYSEDIWKNAADLIAPYLTPGMTVYGEIAGFTPSGGSIQKGYDYGCDNNKKFRLYVYRITLNVMGNVHEFHPDMIKLWRNSAVAFDKSLDWQLNVVPEEYIGTANGVYSIENIQHINDDEERLSLWRTELLHAMREQFHIEEDCDICKNKVPKEGVVVRLLNANGFPAFKFKGTRFFEHETKLLDSGEEDIEEQTEEGADNE